MRRTAGLVTFGLVLVATASTLARTIAPVLERAPGGGSSGGTVTDPMAHGWLLAVLAAAALLVTWLLGATVLQLAAHLWPSARRLRRVADAVAPSVLRGVAGITATVSLSAALPAPLVGLPVEAPAVLDHERAQLVPLDDGTVDDTARLVPLPALDAQPVAAPTAPTPFPELTVRPGDSFWRLADGVVSESLGRPATDREITAYWHRLIEANADRLVVAGEPDLIYAGQVFRRPPVDPAPGARTSLPVTG